jgi:hypothetical protein
MAWSRSIKFPELASLCQCSQQLCFCHVSNVSVMQLPRSHSRRQHALLYFHLFRTTAVM